MAGPGRPRKKPAAKENDMENDENIIERPTEKKAKDSDDVSVLDEFMPKKPSYRVDEVAAFMGNSPSTIRRWIEQGRLETLNQPGYLRVTRRSLVTLEKNMLRIKHSRRL